MEDEMAGLTLDSGEDDVLQFALDSTIPSISFVHCFVGDSNVVPQIKATDCGGILSNGGKGISLIPVTSTVIGAGAVITNQHSGLDFFRIMEPFDVNMGADFEDSPISQAEGLKRHRFQLSNSSPLNGLPTIMVTKGLNTTSSSSTGLAKQTSREP
ncbi:hypothetical protein V6N13_022930 [Hibiscus sabdariffa]|uniref:Uncharacterized protein n=1 Tax=Hibiscus sabdariffa TaxID=183260 RepID=A0ABR2BNJ2_9ROSI